MIGQKPALWNWDAGHLEPAGTRLALGLGGLWPLWDGGGLTARSLVGSNHGTLTNGIPWGRSMTGVGLSNGAGATGYVALSNFSPLETTAVTALVVVRRVQTINDDVLFGRHPAWYMAADNLSSSKIRFTVQTGVGGIVTATGFVIPSTGEDYTFVCRYDGATAELYFEGVLVASAAQTGTMSASGTLRLGGYGGGGFQWHGDIGMAAEWPDLALPRDACRQLSRDPYLLLRARQRVLVAVLAPLAVAPGTGALTAAGLAPVVITPRIVRPGLGSALATGLLPLVVTPRVVLPGTGSAVVAGLAPLIRAAVVLLAGSGDALVDGFAPTVITPSPGLAQPGTGAAQVTGFAPFVAASNPVVVTPGLGSALADGLNPVVLLGQQKVATPGTGQADCTGFAPTIIVAVAPPVVVLPGTGQAIVTGYAPTVGQPDVYAWFPGDGEFRGGRRYEEYAHEKPRRSRRKKKRPPEPLPPLPEAVTEALGAPLTPLVSPLEAESPIRMVPTPAPRVRPPEPPEVYEVPGRRAGEGAHWTDYAHLPVDPTEDTEELKILMDLAREASRGS